MIAHPEWLLCTLPAYETACDIVTFEDETRTSTGS